MAIRAAVKCPNCHAQPGEFCTTTTSGQRADHVSRMNTCRVPPGRAAYSSRPPSSAAGRARSLDAGATGASGVPWPPPKGSKTMLTAKGETDRLGDSGSRRTCWRRRKPPGRDRTVAGMRAYEHAIIALMHGDSGDAAGPPRHAGIRPFRRGHALATGDAVDDVVAVLGADDGRAGDRRPENVAMADLVTSARTATAAG